MKPSGVGGQAVIEGVMMKNKEHYAVAVRKPDNEIVIKEDTFKSVSDKYKIWRLPILRGILAFAESMGIGIKTLNFSASFFEEEEAAKETKVDKAFSKVFKDKTEGILAAITMIIAVVLAVGIFIVLPAFAAGLLGKSIASDSLVAFIEGIIRIVLFVLYVFAISQLKDIKRVFMYHGAEHKTINCVENGFDLTIENVRKQSRQHKRCGTSFLFLVMFVSIIFFMFIRTDNTWIRYASRILLVPVIAGVAYEFIRFAGKNDSAIVRILSKPGMWLQGMTTREPDDDMIEVAIKSVEAVFDWRTFLGKETEAEEVNTPVDSKKVSSTGGKEKQTNKQNSNRTSENKQTGNKKNSSQQNQNKKAAGNKTNQASGKQSNKRNDRAANLNGHTEDTKQNNASNKAARELAASSTRREPLKAMDIFEEDDEILRAVDDFVAITDEAAEKE